MRRLLLLPLLAQPIAGHWTHWRPPHTISPIDHPTWAGTRSCCSTTTTTTTEGQTLASPASSPALPTSPKRHAHHSSRGLLAHARLLNNAMAGGDSPVRKRNRVRGVVRKLEAHHVEWIAELAAEGPLASSRFGDSTALLTALRTAKPCLESHRRERAGGADGSVVGRFLPSDEADAGWTGVSPFFSPQLSDALCLCLRMAAQSPEATASDHRELLHCAVTLELADAEALQSAVQVLTSREYCATCEGHHLVETLRLLSLAVKRCKLQPPPLDHIFCRLPLEKNLSARDALQVLSSLVRLRKIQRAVEVANAVSRNTVPMVATYTIKDVVHGLEAIAILNVCHEVYAGAVLERCAEVAPRMSPKELGDACKYIGQLQTHRASNDVAFTCSREMRRVLPALEERVEALMGTLSLRDARYVLRCFTQHKVRHSIVFSRLTPFAHGS